MSAATLNNLLSQMYDNQEVLNGWDACLNLLESSVNTFFQDQFNQQTGNTGKMSISTIWCEGVQPFHSAYFTNVTQVVVDLGPPLFQFESGNAVVTVKQQILSGQIKIGTKGVSANFQPNQCGCSLNEADVDWSQTTSIDPAANPYLEGQIPLEKVSGSVQGTQSLILNFGNNAFTPNNLTIHGLDNGQFADQIMNWFINNRIQYVLASLSLENHTGLSGFTPSSFEFNVLVTNAGNTIVQLLITTDGNQPSGKIIAVNEPIPTDDSYTCSLMVSSRILYNDVLIAGFNKVSNSFQLLPVSPPAADKIWQAAIDPEMNFAGRFSFGSCCDRTTVTYSIWLGGNYAGSENNGFHLSQSINTQGNVHVNIEVSADYPLTLSGSGQSQELVITPGTPSVTVSGSCEGEIKSRLQSILDGDFKNGMGGISFSPVTYFALRNLLFPGNLFQMSEAQTPGDLLIVGTFEPT